MKRFPLILIALLCLAGCASDPIQVEVKHEHRVTFERKTDPNNPRPLQALIDQLKAIPQQTQAKK